MDQEKQEAIERYKERRERKVTRLLERADSAHAKAIESAKRSREIQSFIPLGQPILVGHHSEGRHRRDLKRIGSLMGKAFEEQDKAQALTARAENLQDSRVIDAADPEASDKLGSKVEALREDLAEMKRINAEFRKTKALHLVEMSVQYRERAQHNQTCWKGGPPFPAYELSNCNARIKHAADRAATVGRASEFQAMQFGEVSAQLVDGYIVCKFPGRPSDEMRRSLKCAPLALKWSRFQNAWVRKIGPGTATRWFSDHLAKTLEAASKEAFL
jgi:hypothetical protein